MTYFLTQAMKVQESLLLGLHFGPRIMIFVLFKIVMNEMILEVEVWCKKMVISIGMYVQTESLNSTLLANFYLANNKSYVMQLVTWFYCEVCHKFHIFEALHSPC